VDDNDDLVSVAEAASLLDRSIEQVQRYLWEARAYYAQCLAVAEDEATLLTADGPLFKDSRSVGIPAQLLP
jgi:hypothetical protein